MVKFINKFTGNVMYVSESRVEEYNAAGHKLAASDTEPAKEKPKRKPRKSK